MCLFQVRCHNPEDLDLRHQLHEDIKTRKKVIWFVQKRKRFEERLQAWNWLGKELEISLSLADTRSVSNRWKYLCVSC
jgi:hypothetical protein